MNTKNSYERIAQQLLIGQPKPARTAWFDGTKLLSGTKSLHRTVQSRRWNLFWKIKKFRVDLL